MNYSRAVPLLTYGVVTFKNVTFKYVVRKTN